MISRLCASSTRARAKTSNAPSLERRAIALDGRIDVASIARPSSRNIPPRLSPYRSGLLTKFFLEILCNDSLRHRRRDLGPVTAGAFHEHGERELGICRRRVGDEPGRVRTSAAVGFYGSGLTAEGQAGDC